uniref:F-box domain-containing protein n=2 Tax=Ditylenchus dipsaci TaxID=166011 RepID=A0A915EGM7_9BILA
MLTIQVLTNEVAMQSGNETDSSTLSAFSTSFNDDSILRQRPTSHRCRAVAKFSRRRVSIVPTTLLYNPVNVIYRIFSYLNKRDLVSLMMTCKDLQTLERRVLSGSSSISSEEHYRNSLHAILDRKIKVLLKSDTDDSEFSSWCSPPPVIRCSLSHLDLSYAKFSKPAILDDFLERCHNLIGSRWRHFYRRQNMLVELNIGWADFSNETISIACGLFPPSLEKLSFSGTRDLSEMNDWNVKRICEDCSNLQELDLSDDTVITEKALEYINKLPRLKMLWIEPMSFLSLQNLKVLNVYGCLTEDGYDVLRNRLRSTGVNVSPFTCIAQPTVGESVSSIWGQRTRDWY